MIEDLHGKNWNQYSEITLQHTLCNLLSQQENDQTYAGVEKWRKGSWEKETKRKKREKKN